MRAFVPVRLALVEITPSLARASVFPPLGEGEAFLTPSLTLFGFRSYRQDRAGANRCVRLVRLTPPERKTPTVSKLSAVDFEGGVLRRR